MAGITAAQVKELRERTGAGMMDCKKALGETAGDMGDAADWLRKKGLAAAAKKAGRVAAEGLIGVAVRDGVGAVVEVNAETDFVARNETFQAFVSQVAEIALDTGGDLDRIQAADCPGTGRTVAEELTHLIATIGENMSLRRATLVDAGDGVIASYIHNLVAPGQGRIGVLVGVAGGGDREAMAAFGRQVAMHVAATAPQAVTVGDLDPAVVERERRFLTDQAATSGKPPDIVERMVEGRLRKFYEEIVLMEQTWVIDGETRVGDVVEALAGETGGAPAVTGFVRFALGEGIEKGETDFAAEVAGLVDGDG